LVIPTIVGILLILVCAIVQGLWTERWGTHISDQLLAFAEAFDEIPELVEDWEGEDNVESESSEREMEAAGAAAQVSRTYRNPKTGESVSVYMICGASRSVAVHTPDACYPGAGFRMEDEIRNFSIHTGASEAEFKTATFLKEEPSGTQRLRVFWAWNANGVWEAPEWPRMRYGGRTPLNKMYLIAQTPYGQAVDQSPCMQFAEVFIPEVNRVLFPGQSDETSVPVAAPAEKLPADLPPQEPAQTSEEDAAK